MSHSRTLSIPFVYALYAHKKECSSKWECACAGFSYYIQHINTAIRTHKYFGAMTVNEKKQNNSN